LFEPELGDEEVEALTAVVRSRWLTMGDRIKAFETEFASFVGCRHAVAVSSCTAALHLALEAVGVGPGDEVITPALTFVAAANTIVLRGARPVFVDVSSLDDWNVGRRTIEPAITERTKALVVLHYGGYPADMAPIVELARERDIAIIEDAAHAPGARREGVAVGAWGDVGCFSFFSNKNLTTGEGGMLTTNRTDLVEPLQRLRSHGMTTLTLDRHRGHAFSYDVDRVGYNYRMSELNAAIGLVQLRHLPERTKRRNELARSYRKALEGVPGLEVPFSACAGDPAVHIMPVLLPRSADREAVMAELRESGIQSSIHYRPVNTFTAYRRAGLGAVDRLPHTHEIGARMITLPFFPAMTDDQMHLVCESLSRALPAAAGR
jgi:dTDP-4-amino-4,6-dideoxygalactose transaminase